MAAKAPTGEIWLSTIAKIYLAWYDVHLCQVSCFYHKMHDSLNVGHLAAGLIERIFNAPGSVFNVAVQCRPSS